MGDSWIEVDGGFVRMDLISGITIDERPDSWLVELWGLNDVGEVRVGHGELGGFASRDEAHKAVVEILERK